MTATNDRPAGRFWRRGRLGQIWAIAAVPVASVFLALFVAALIILASSVITTGSIDWLLPLKAYGALLEGSLGSETAILNTILQATPLVLGGLAVGIGFKAGLFNIGGQGQFLLGATAAAGVGAALATAPAPIAITAAILAGMLAGAAWGWIPGALKALTGAHEVVTTIMLNSIAAALIGLLTWAVTARARSGILVRAHRRHRQQRPAVHPRPQPPPRDHLRVAASSVVRWLLYRSDARLRDPHRRDQSQRGTLRGMRPAFITTLTMTICGLLSASRTDQMLGVIGFTRPSYRIASASTRSPSRCSVDPIPSGSPRRPSCSEPSVPAPGSCRSGRACRSRSSTSSRRS